MRKLLRNLTSVQKWYLAANIFLSVLCSVALAVITYYTWPGVPAVLTIMALYFFTVFIFERRNKPHK